VEINKISLQISDADDGSRKKQFRVIKLEVETAEILESPAFMEKCLLKEEGGGVSVLYVLQLVKHKFDPTMEYVQITSHELNSE
jgi:hypothetical protein